MAQSKKPTPAAKPAAAAKKADAPEKKSSAIVPSKPSAKSTPSTPAESAAAAPVPPASAPVPPVAKTKGAEKANARDALRSRILGAKKPAKPIAFSLDEVREIAKTVAAKTPETEDKANKAVASTKVGKIDPAKAVVPVKPAQPNHVKAASLADILGFNPKKTAPKAPEEEDAEIPEKFRRFYRLLIELRNHVTGQLDQHTEDTLKRSSKDDAGDLSSYGQHMADAGTDTFDRDFALSLVSSEQEALSEIEAAIQRIKAGTYGVCEITQKPIAKERLMAVPFTRYSAEAQKEIEKNRYRTRTGAGLFGELGEEGASLGGGDGGDDE